MEPSKFEPKYLLAEFEDLNDQINDILKSTSRIKYTCFDVSQQFIIFGSTSGSLYVFNRNPCQFLQIIPNQTGPVTHVSISHNEDWIAFSCKKGLVYVVQRPTGILHVTPSTQISYEHEGNSVTALRWDFHRLQLFIGDDTGRVSVLHLHRLIGTKILHTSSFLLLELKNPIVQLDTSEELLLVSSITKTVLCNTHRQIFQQIGLRPRHGKFGACFMNSRALGSIYCARPGNRLWEVDLNGSVLCTHKFTDLITKPNKIINATTDDISNKRDSNLCDERKLNKNFNKLFPINNRLILTYSSDIIQILNPSNCEIMLRAEEYSNIASCAVLNNILYIFTKNRSFHEVHLMTIEELIVKCHFLQYYTLSSNLSQEHEKYLIQRIKQETTFSKLQTFQKLFTKYELKSDVNSILCELLNYSSGESSDDEIFDNEILYKRDRRKQIKEDAIKNTDQDFVSDLNKTDAAELPENHCDLPLTKQNFIFDNKSSDLHKVEVESQIEITKPDVVQEDIENCNVDKEIQPEKSNDVLISSQSCADGLIENRTEIKNVLDLKEIINEENDFAGQGQTSNQSLTSDICIEISSIIFDLKMEKNSFDNQSNVKTEIDADLGFEHLGDVDTQVRKETLLVTDLEIDKSKNKCSWKDIKLPDKNLKAIELLYAVIVETRKSQCTIPKKLPKLKEFDTTDIITIFKNLHDYVLFKEGNQYEPAVYECSKLFLQYVTLHLSMFDSINIVQEYLLNSLIAVETSRSKTCICGYPMPQQTSKPLFYGLCKRIYALSGDLNKRIDLCGKIPYLWHLIIDQEKDPSINKLTLIMQLDYKKGFDVLSKSFTEEDYMNVIDYKITLNSNRCLLCFSKFESELHTSELISYNISWNHIGNCMYRSFGGTRTLNMLISKSNEIPKGSLDLEFYHFLMLNP